MTEERYQTQKIKPHMFRVILPPRGQGPKKISAEVTEAVLKEVPRSPQEEAALVEVIKEINEEN